MDKKAMLNGLVMLIDWFNSFTNGALQHICGPLVDFVLKASGENGEKWIEGFKRFLRDETVTKEPSLLSRVATINVVGTAKFVAANHLKAANVGWTNDHFKRLFLNKVEKNVGDTALTVSRLERDSLDPPILTELGGRAETSLAHMFSLLEKQSNGKTGYLLTNGCANIFYVRGTYRNPWAMRACWCSGDDHWRVLARSVEHPDGWGAAGDQVFSCGS